MKALDSKDRQTEFKPTNIPYVILGASLLWFGWFGFNAGSALAANDVAVSALVVTNLADLQVFTFYAVFGTPCTMSNCKGNILYICSYISKIFICK